MTLSDPTSGAVATEDVQPTFDVLPLSSAVRRAVDELGYTHPTPVQQAVFQSVASGRDIVVQARTGTGKTAAFGLPVVDRLVDVTQKATQVLVLSPTRELALQINRELEGLAAHNGVACTAVYGGASMQPQIDAIRRGAQVIAGTPGRVLDHLERGTLDPSTIRALVLDESDEMLSMGFLPQITKIMERLPAVHQTLLFSATLPPDVRRIAETRLQNPEFITLSGDHIGALSIDHYVYRSAGNKSDELVQILDIESPESAIIFCNTRDQTKRIATALNRKGYAADWLNADLAQNDREKVMKATREGKLRFLVCTDVAARGIDISHLTHVINADFPDSTENYVHRTGRTGRAGKTGTAISLIAPQDVGNLYMLRLTYKIFPIERDLPSAGDLQTRKESDLVQFLHKAFSSDALPPGDLSLARRVLSSDVAETIVAGLLRDHLGGHPHFDEQAALKRREQAPPAVNEEANKEKKSKKKRDKGRKKDKDKDKDRESPSGVVHKTDLSPPQRQEDRPLRERASDAVSDSLKDERSAETDGKHSKSKNRRNDRDKHSSGDSKHTSNSAGLEVVSAADLLNAEELSLLNGNHDDGSQRRRIEPKQKSHSKIEDDRQKQEEQIFVDVGKLDGVVEDDFYDTLEGKGFPSEEVLFVRIRDTHSFLGVPPELLKDAVAALDGGQVGGLEVLAEKARPRRKPA